VPAAPVVIRHLRVGFGWRLRTALFERQREAVAPRPERRPQRAQPNPLVGGGLCPPPATTGACPRERPPPAPLPSAPPPDRASRRHRARWRAKPAAPTRCPPRRLRGAARTVARPRHAG